MPARVAAYTCDSQEGVSLEYLDCLVLPRTADKAPPNTRIRVFCTSWLSESGSGAPASPFRFYLRRKKGPIVEVNEQRLPRGGMSGIELRPKGPLNPNTPFEVVARTREGKTRVISSFMTGETPDESPPRGVPVIGGRPLIFNIRTDANNEAEVVARLTVGDVSDESTPAASLLYAVWTGAPGRPIDFGQPPPAYFASKVDAQYGGHFIVDMGNTDVCENGSSLTPPKIYKYKDSFMEWKDRLLSYESGRSALPWPRGIRLNIGIRAIDLAGNAGEPTELTLNFDHPGTVYHTSQEDTRGYSCEGKIQRRVQVFPRATDIAPVNAQVRVLMTQIPGILPKYISLRSSDGRQVRGRHVESFTGDTGSYALIPEGHLNSRTRYRVFDSDGVQLSTFVTGESVDTTAPTGQAVKAATLGPKRLRLESGDVADDQTPRASLLFLLWTPQQGNRIDFQSVPTTYFLAEGSVATLGTALADCKPNTLSLPAERSTWRIGVRVVDLAGNLGLPSELTVDSFPPLRLGR